MDDVYTEKRRAWVREQHAPGHRLEPNAEQHILTRKRYTNSANTDIRKLFTAVRKQMEAA